MKKTVLSYKKCSRMRMHIEVVATKRNKLQMFTMMAKVHGTTKRRIHAVDYLIDIFCKIFIKLL